MKTIIGFDSWTEGAHHFDRLVEPLRKRGYQLILVHIGSWGHDLGRQKQETIGGLCVRDISYYKSMGFDEILLQERPAAVVFFSTRSITHMAMIRYARQLKIPTCHLYHGLVMVQAYGPRQRAYRTNYLRHLVLVSERLSKNLIKILPVYARAIFKTDHSARDWISFIDLILRRGTGMANRRDPFIPDTETDMGCVYTAADVNHMQTNYQIPLSQIHVVGNPDIAKFGLAPGDLGYGLLHSESAKKIIYLDTALVESGLVFKSNADFVRHIKKTRDAIQKTGFDFLVKLHPAHHLTNTPEKLAAAGIVLCPDDEFIQQLKNSSAAIVEPSTAAIIPALMGMPVFLASYGKLSSQNYGPVLESYPRSKLLTNISKINGDLSTSRTPDLDIKVMQWIDQNAGPLPAEAMPERAAREICNLISTANLLHGG